MHVSRGMNKVDVTSRLPPYRTPPLGGEENSLHRARIAEAENVDVSISRNRLFTIKRAGTIPAGKNICEITYRYVQINVYICVCVYFYLASRCISQLRARVTNRIAISTLSGIDNVSSNIEEKYWRHRSCAGKKVSITTTLRVWRKKHVFGPSEVYEEFTLSFNIAFKANLINARSNKARSI